MNPCPTGKVEFLQRVTLRERHTCAAALPVLLSYRRNRSSVAPLIVFMTTVRVISPRIYLLPNRVELISLSNVNLLRPCVFVVVNFTQTDLPLMCFYICRWVSIEILSVFTSPYLASRGFTVIRYECFAIQNRAFRKMILCCVKENTSLHSCNNIFARRMIVYWIRTQIGLKLMISWSNVEWRFSKRNLSNGLEGF